MKKNYEAPELVELGTAAEIVLGPTDDPPPDNGVGYDGRMGETLADAE